MIVTPKALCSAQYAPATDTVVYTVPSGSRVIIDKFTATNNDSTSRDLSINILPSAATLVSAANLIVSAKSISAGFTQDFSEIQNQILNGGETISVLASVASAIVIRVSGREVT